MILDNLAEFDTPTTSAASMTTAGGLSAAGSVLSTYSYDMFAAGVPTATGPDGLTIGGPLLHDIGRGRPVGIVVQITSSMSSTGSATMEVDIITSTSTTLAGSTTVIVRSPAVPVASLTAQTGSLTNGYTGNSYRYQFKTLPPKLAAQRYLGLQYVVGAPGFASGAFEAGVVFTGPDDHADIFG